MDEHTRKNVAKFLVDSVPMNGGWTEKRLAFKWNDNIYIVGDNFPHWTTTQIKEWLRETGTEYFYIEVKVVPEARMGGNGDD